MSLRSLWDRLNQRYAALSRRERILVALAVVLGPLLIGHSLFVDPQSARLKGMQNTVATEEATVARLQAEASSLQQQLAIDPDAGRKADLAALIAERDASLVVRAKKVDTAVDADDPYAAYQVPDDLMW